MTIAEQFRREGKMEIAINMLQEGISLEMIYKLTYLSSSEFEDLKKKIH